jgi:predicted dehydrogenase
MMKASTVTVGVVGCGGISAKTHLPVLKAMNDVRIGWVTDAQPSQARR